MTLCKVSFCPHVKRYSYDKDWSSVDFCCDSLYLDDEAPCSNHMENVATLFARTRQRDVTVLFGNLGRRLSVLTHFIQLCFTSNERVGIYSKWKFESPYRIDSIEKLVGKLDFLFILEPPFGYFIPQPTNVKHVIVLSSHMCLHFQSFNRAVSIVHVGSTRRPVALQAPPNKYDGVRWRPPIFFDFSKSPDDREGPVDLDVINVTSAHEAYLRLLTAREMIVARPYTISLDPRDHVFLRQQLQQSFSKVDRLWSDDWIRDVYFKGFDTNSDGTVKMDNCLEF